MEENFSFGYWLRRQRLARDLRQAEFAAQLGIAPVTLRKIEADERRPSLQLITRLAEVLGLDEAEHRRLLQVARADLAPAALPLPERAADLDALPSGTLTFLFTDIEGSTRHWEQQPDAMRDALTQHNQLLQQAIADGGGTLIKHTGDGMLAVFTRCEHAVAAAVVAQRLLVANEWPTTQPLLVRMAMHTGTVELQGKDYVGPALNRAARLLAAGHGGQIVLSLAAAELARDHLPAGVALRELGSYRLRDLARPEQVFQVVADGLPDAFPPLHTLDARRHNLPAQTTALIGREREVADLCNLLLKPDVRLATLTGPGGTGKTRLALQAAAELVEQFRDGVWFVNLASVTDAERVVEAIAHVLGLRESGAMPLRDVLHAAIRDQQLLLILDNFEQVLDAAPEVSALLEQAPNIRVIVTSRAVLRLRAEHVVGVSPLSLPERQAPLTHTQLSQYDAVRLFIERSRAVRHDFDVTHANAPAIAEICWRLDGLPLAIELAAARMRLFSPEALLTRLDQRLPLLTTGSRDLPTRQQTLRATIEWSYALLGDAERTLLGRLAVCEGGWDPGAAAALGELDELGAFEVLEALADKSLIRQAESPDGEPRFTMLETIQEFALEQLQAHGEAEQARRLHAQYYLALAETSEAHMTGSRREAWLARLDLETHNLHAAFLWYQTATDGRDSLQRLAGALWWFWYFRGYAQTGCMWLETALAQPSTDLDAASQAKLLLGSGALADQLGEHEPARQRLEESIAHARLIDQPELLGLALTFLGLVLGHQGRFGEATAPHTESLDLFRSTHHRWGEALATQYLGEIYWFQGLLETAYPLFEQSAELFGELGDQWGRARALGLLGFVAHDQGKHEQARVFFEEAIAGMQVIGDTFVLAVLFNKNGQVLRCLDDTRAVSMFEESRALFLKLGNRFWTYEPLRNLGCVMLEQGDLGQAADYLRQSIQVTYEAGYLEDMSVSLTCLACVATQQKHYRRAATLHGAASKLLQMEIPVDPANRRLIDKYQTVAQTRLDADTYATHWQFGHALTTEQILAFAYDDTHEQ